MPGFLVFLKKDVDFYGAYCLRYWLLVSSLYVYNTVNNNNFIKILVHAWSLMYWIWWNKSVLKKHTDIKPGHSWISFKLYSTLSTYLSSYILLHIQNNFIPGPQSNYYLNYQKFIQKFWIQIGMYIYLWPLKIKQNMIWWSLNHIKSLNKRFHSDSWCSFAATHLGHKGLILRGW